MIDPMYTMIHKAILHIVPSHAMYADSLWNEVISFFHAEITHTFHSARTELLFTGTTVTDS